MMRQLVLITEIGPKSNSDPTLKLGHELDYFVTEEQPTALTKLPKRENQMLILISTIYKKLEVRKLTK